MEQTTISLIDPFAEIDIVPDTITDQFPVAKWINILGEGKRGKTLTMLKLLQNVRGAYFDLEEGTKPYGAKVFQIHNYAEVRKSLAFIEDNRSKLDLDVIVLDPFDKLQEYVMNSLYAEFNVDDLSAIKVKGKGNGWTLFYSRINNILSALFRSARMLVTITHFKLSYLSRDDNRRIALLDLNLMGQVRTIVKDGADAHLVFTYGKLTPDSPKEIIVSTSMDTEFYDYEFGARGGILAPLQADVKRPDDLINFLTAMLQDKPYISPYRTQEETNEVSNSQAS